MAEDHQAVLHRYLRMQRESLLYKLDGLSERDARTPMTPTGTNADLWATPAQTIGWLQGFAERVWAHADQTVAELSWTPPATFPGGGSEVR